MKVTVTENGRTIEFEVPSVAPVVKENSSFHPYDYGFQSGLRLAMNVVDELIEAREARYKGMPTSKAFPAPNEQRERAAASAECSRVFGSVLWLKKAKAQLQKELVDRA